MEITKETIDSIASELSELIGKKRDIDKRIATLIKRLKGDLIAVQNAKLRQEIEWELRIARLRQTPESLGDAIMKVMSENKGSYLTASDVRRKLRQAGFSLDCTDSAVGMFLKRKVGKSLRERRRKGMRGVAYIYDAREWGE